MTPKERRDRKNANHRRNEQRKFDRRVDAMFRPFAPMLMEQKRQLELAAAIDEARKLAWESGAFGFR